MTSTTINRLLDRLDEAKRQFGPGADKLISQILRRLAKREITDPDALIRFHEILLFISAYPQSAPVKKIAESLLGGFAKRVAALREAGVDLSPLETPEVSGIFGTSVTDTFTFSIVRWLVRRQPARVALDWEWFEDENRLAETWPRFMPLLEEDSSVEANVPYQAWLRAAKGPGVKDLTWLVQRFDSLPRTNKEKAELFDSQKVYVRWTPAYRASRTGMRLPARKVFYHRSPLIQRREISLKQELAAPPPDLKLLNSKRGEAILDMAREASTVRYRELYGFTHGDPGKVFSADLGRGVEAFITALPPYWRLPLRAYHAAMFFKNGVPVGYFEGLSLFERMESGFNLYYSFRDGETAWLYARTLNIFRHLLGVTAFAIDPYQIGYENEEGIESGAFWFYRKLGFRPTNTDVAKLVSQEEDRLAHQSKHRSSSATLRKLAKGPMIFELDQTKAGDWDRFQVRNIGLAVQQRMGRDFKGDADRLRANAMERLSRVLGMRGDKTPKTELAAFVDFAATLSLVKELGSWSSSEKKLLGRIIRAKSRADESVYLKLMQQHTRLRQVMIKLGAS